MRGRAFRFQVINRLPKDLDYNPDGEYEVHTEYQSGGSRFDILLRPLDTTTGKNGLVFENKIKSLGTHLQLDQYKKLGYDVAVLALLPEALDNDTEREYPVLTYGVLRDALNDCFLHSESPYQFLVQQYRDFLDRTLGAYFAITDYCHGRVALDEFIDRLERATGGVTFGDNDIRTFDYFCYYYRLAQFMKQSACDLVFGSCNEYKTAKERQLNTCWFYEKNMAGPPFMEAMIYAPWQNPGWALHPALRANDPGFCISSRIEIELNL